MEIALAIAAVLAAVFGFKWASTSRLAQRQQDLAREVERRRREQAAMDAGKAMQEAARERDDALRQRPTDTINDAMRRGR